MKIRQPAKIILVIIILAGLLLPGCYKQNSERRDAAVAKKNTEVSEKVKYTRTPTYAGQFYEGNPERLKKSINQYLEKADVVEIPGTLVGLISPHAGYIYSGPVAAYGYKQLVEKKYDTVIVLAPSHRARFGGVSIIPSGVYRTPLGDVPIDSELAKKIASHNPDKFGFVRGVHEAEHSLEVQVPFLQATLQEGWKIVPIVYGDNDLRTCAMVAEAIAPHYDPGKHLIVASTDMSHYYPYEKANEMDRVALKYVTSLDIEGLIDAFKAGKCELCGTGPVLTIMVFTRALGGKAKLLKYANSGDTSGRKGEVVGYCSVAFYIEKKETEATDSPKNESETEIQFKVTDEQKKMLLDMARKTLNSKIKYNRIPDFDYQDPLLEREIGLFVTLRKQPGEQLRGCIGHIFAQKKLAEALPELTVASATQDPRFPPVRESELDDINIEISLLSPPKKIDDWRKIKIPGHGVYVKRGFKRGVFLPQVADETGWDRDTFMEHLCVGKAGLPPDAWKDPDTELYIFTVIKFTE